MVFENLDLYVICVKKILSTNIMLVKTSSGLSWNREVVSLVFKFRLEQELNYGSPIRIHVSLMGSRVTTWRMTRALCRGRGIKEMSVDCIANLRNRLAEERRMLKTRSEMDEACHARVEYVTFSSCSVQRDVSHQNYFLGGNNKTQMHF